MTKIKAVLFDLGGVLVELSGEQHLLALLGNRMTREQMWEQWLHSSAVRAHETGRISATQFAQDLVVEFGIGIPAEEFLAGFRGWLKAPFPGAQTLLDDTTRRFTTGILSNTSGMHWPIVEGMDLHHRVHHIVVSHEVGELRSRDATGFVSTHRGRLQPPLPHLLARHAIAKEAKQMLLAAEFNEHTA